MIKFAFILALLTVTDPVTGPAGAGGLTPPTAAVYRNLAAFDLQEITVLDADTVQLELQMASFSNPYGLPLGFSHPIIDIYLGGREPGRSELLPGHGMRLPQDEQWHVAFRLNGDSARGYEVQADGEVREFSPAVELDGDRLLISTAVPALANPRIAALVGLYDPFQESGWRPLASHPSAWAFSGGDQIFPVLDVLALDEDAQRAALLSGILPVTEASTPPVSKALWLLFMAAGLTIAGAGLLLRTRIVQDSSAGPAEFEPEPGTESKPELVPVASDSSPQEQRASEDSPGPETDGADENAADDEIDAVASLQVPDSATPEKAPMNQADEVPIVRINYFRGSSPDSKEAATVDTGKRAETHTQDQRSEPASFEVDFSEVEPEGAQDEVSDPAVQPAPEQD